MVKKRLGDLLREEVQKPINQENQVILQADVDVPVVPASTEAQEVPASGAEALTLSELSEVTLPEVPNLMVSEEKAANLQVGKLHARRGYPTKADLEAKVVALETALAEIHDREAAWQQKIHQLHAETEQQQAQIANLQTELHQMVSLKTELTFAKAELEQFGSAKAELDQARADLAQARADLKAAEPLKAEIEQLKGAIRNLSEENNKLSNLAKQLSHNHPVQPDRQPNHPLYPTIPTRPPIARSGQSGRLSNSDIGWVD